MKENNPLKNHWDQSFFWRLLAIKLFLMERHFRYYSIIDYNQARKLSKVCKKLKCTCRRLAKEDYNDEYLTSAFPDDFSFSNFDDPRVDLKKLDKHAKEEQYLINQDMEYFFYMLKKHIRTLWD